MKRAATVAIFALCFAADAWVLRHSWTGRQVNPGQFRRGYFERFDAEVGLAVDNAVSAMFPSFLLTASGELEVPAGMTVVAPLAPNAQFALVSNSTLAPYVVVGMEGTITPLTRSSCRSASQPRNARNKRSPRRSPPGREDRMMADGIRDNPDRGRFEMDAGNDIAFVNYRLAPGVITLSHTEVPEELEGQGLGSRIVRGVLDTVRARGLKVVPACGFVAAFIRKNPAYRDLLV